MKANSKLPMPLQLVGVTAALVFAVSTANAISLTLTLANGWHLVAGMPRTWSGFYYPIFGLLTFYFLLSVLSAAMFSALLFGRGAVLPRAAIAYLAALGIALAWRIYLHFPSDGIHGIRSLSLLGQLYFALRILYAIWLVWLAHAVMPNYSLKRTAADGLR